MDVFLCGMTTFRQGMWYRRYEELYGESGARVRR
jgi:hypothetical protein